MAFHSTTQRGWAVRLSAALAAFALLVSGCASGNFENDTAKSEKKTELTVFAASSLTGAMGDIAKQYEKEEGVHVVTSFAGSQTLASQINDGAPADVLATANEETMKKVSSATNVKTFALGTLVLATPEGNPGNVTGLDESLEGKRLVICAEAVPCGRATKKLTGILGITLKPVSEEQAVGDVIGKLTTGAADAGIVYTTDAKTAKLPYQEIPQADKAANSYQIATLSSDNAEAKKFYDYVLGEKGTAILKDYGFTLTEN